MRNIHLERKNRDIDFAQLKILLYEIHEILPNKVLNATLSKYE